MSKKILLFVPMLAMSLVGCSNTGTHHDVSEYKAGEITLSDDEFNVLQLCDIHLSNKDNQELQLNFLDLTISEAVSDGVDLIVLDGDVFTFADEATVNKFFSFLDGYNVPWTMTFGNHDEQCYFSVTWLTSHLNKLGESSESNCIFKDIQGDDLKGNANFYIDVKDKEGNPFERVIIMDSNRYHFSTDYMGYDYIYPEQIEWYKEVVNQTNSPKSLLFFHIPLPEFENAIKDRTDGKITGEDDLGGTNGEGISNAKRNSGFFEVIEEEENTQGIFCAHDHENDSGIYYHLEGFTYKVLLSYGTNSTDRIYSDKDKTGGQLITVESDHSLTLTRYHHYYSEVEGK